MTKVANVKHGQTVRIAGRAGAFTVRRVRSNIALQCNENPHRFVHVDISSIEATDQQLSGLSRRQFERLKRFRLYRENNCNMLRTANELGIAHQALRSFLKKHAGGCRHRDVTNAIEALEARL